MTVQATILRWEERKCVAEAASCNQSDGEDANSTNKVACYNTIMWPNRCLKDAYGCAESECTNRVKGLYNTWERDGKNGGPEEASGDSPGPTNSPVGHWGDFCLVQTRMESCLTGNLKNRSRSDARSLIRKVWLRPKGSPPGNIVCGRTCWVLWS